VGNKFGRVPEISISSAPTDIWQGGTVGSVGLYSGFNAVQNENLQTLSASTNDVGSLEASGTATGGDSSVLVDSGATFVTDGILAGDLIINDTQGFHGTVKSVDSETQLTTLGFSDDDPVGIFEFASGDSYRIARAAGTGASVVKWTKVLNDQYQDQGPFYVILNGTTPVLTTGDFFRLSRGRIVQAGSLGTSAGILTARQATTTANIFARLPTGTNATAIACDTVPAGLERVIYSSVCRITRDNGSPGSANVRLLVRRPGGLFTTLVNDEITVDSPYRQPTDEVFILRAGTDIKWNVNSVSDNSTVASGKFAYVDFKI
jgi:hypothetical protein